MTKFYAALCAVCISASAIFAQQTAQDTNNSPSNATTAQTQRSDSSSGSNASSTGSPGATAASATNLSDKDRKFIDKAARAGLFEVRSSELAQQKASSASIKDFASTMVTDHQKANDELKSIAAKLGVTIPASLEEKQQEELQKMQSQAGAELDKSYAKAQKKAHDEAVELFKKASEESENPDLKAFAQKTLPTLQSHLEQAKALNDKSANQ